MAITYIQKLDIPESFKVPELLETSKFRLRPLTMNDAVKDYDALMTSLDYIAETRGVDYGAFNENMTLEDSLKSCAWHEVEFQNRNSFAYTVVSLDEKITLGCVYIYNADGNEFDAEISLWTRKSEKDSGLRKEVYAVVKEWIKNEWPFENPLFLGEEA